MTTQFSKILGFKKQQAEQKLFGVIYPNGFVDSQKDFTDREQLEKAVEYVALNEAWPRMVNVNHSDEMTDAIIVESFVAKEDSDLYFAGDWVATIKCDDKTWGRVESGEFQAFSIEGKSQRERVTLDDGSEASKLYDLQVERIALVNRGANQQFFVTKSDAPKWAQDLAAQIEQISYRIDAIDIAEPQVGDFVRRDGQWLKKVAVNTYQQATSTESASLEKQRARPRRASEARKPKRRLGRRAGQKTTIDGVRNGMKKMDELKADHGRYSQELFAILNRGGPNNRQEEQRVDVLHAELNQLESEGAVDFGDVLTNSAHAFRNRGGIF